jgi:hypothetical protein
VPESSIVVRPESPDSPTYTAASRLQASGLQPAVDLFVEAAKTIPLPKPPNPILIADYGAGTAHNALLPISHAIRALRNRTPQDQPVLLAHTDVPDNDFTALFDTLENDPDSYLRTESAVYASAVGRSFYQQVLPSHSVSLGWSSWAIHWLSRVPMPIPDHVLPAYSTDTAVRTACAKQAAHDWHEFIAFRGRELTPQGRLVVLTMGLDEDEQLGLRPLVESLYTGLRELVSSGLITAQELHGMSIPIVGRSEKDFVAPFAPKDRFEGLSIEHLETYDADDRYYHQYRADKDARSFGRQWGAFMRAATFGCLVAGLAGGAADPRAAEFCDRLERSIAEQMADSPQQVHMPMAKLVLLKHSLRN